MSCSGPRPSGTHLIIYAHIMVGVTTLAIIAIAMPEWRSVSADARHKRHQTDQHHSDGGHTHVTSREPKITTHVDKHGIHGHEGHITRRNDSHRANRKSGALNKQASLLQAVTATATDALGKTAPIANQSLGNNASPAVNAGDAPAVPIAATPNPVAQQQTPAAVPATPGQANGNDAGNTGNNSDTFACSYLWFLFDGCNNSNTKNNTNGEQDSVSAPQNNVIAVGNADQQPVPPVVSSSCTIYGTTVLSLNDFKDAEENGWILISDSNTPKITHNKQVNLDKPAQLPLKVTLCNAATYEATIKLGVDSSGGFIIRGSDQDFVVFEMNTLAKTATLKSINGAYQDIITEVACDQINSQFVQKIQINDTGYKGQIDVSIDGRKIITATRMPYKSSGYFGLYISQGNATFGDLSVVPLTGDS